METSNHNYVKLIVLLLLFLILILYYVSLQTSRYGLKKQFKKSDTVLNKSQILMTFTSILTTTISNHTIINNDTMNITSTISSSTTSTTTTTTEQPITIITTTTTTEQPITIITTTTTNLPTTLDPAELLVERAPPISRTYNKDSKGTLAVFLFQTQHHILADVQLYLIRKLTIDLIAIELFTDGPATLNMSEVANTHKAILHSFPLENHQRDAGPSDRNTDVVNWAISTRAKRYLGNGTAILLLDGDVFPLSPFDSVTLLNGRDVVCRKHPALFARFCWIGFICIGPHLYNTIDDFNVSQAIRADKAYDSGGRTADFFLKYENVSFSWMKETALLRTDKDLFWGAMDEDIAWIKQSFDPCDKCGPEIFFSQFNNSNAVFYHMISGTSEWRFWHQAPRRQVIHDSIMRSPYGSNQQYSISDMIASVKKVQKMETIPFFGNLSCQNVCKG